MKKLSLILVILTTVFLGSCKKDIETVVIKESLTQNALSSLSPATVVLSMDNAASTFQTFRWTHVDYGFNAVETHVLQFDLKSDNFKSPIALGTVTGDTSLVVKVGDINKLMLSSNMSPDVAVDLQFRVVTTINSAIAAINSNIAEAKVTPYATSFPPIYMCGAATGGWSWDPYVYKEMRSSAPNVYKTVAKFLNGETFRFFKQVGWSPTAYNYPYFTGTVSNLFTNASDGDSNFRFTGTTGYYEITVSMSSKSVAMTAVDEPVLYMTGAALGGWDWSTNFVKLTWKSNGIFQATTDFAVEAFRFFKQAGWGDSYNYPWFAGGTVSPLFTNANDGDSNFKFVGTPGSYTITVNLLDKIVTMTQP
jgi:starch-binding outer membrane protein SusE/F